MIVKENISLKEFNSFGIDAKASTYIELENRSDLKTIFSSNKYNNPFILSGGSNLLLMNDLDLVIHIKLKGIEVIKETDEHVYIKAMAGENWHEFVSWSIDQNYGGLENLSLIPGFVGSAPIQNIGAYGVEQKDCFVSCEVFDRTTKSFKSLDEGECEFGYRDSVFKSKKLNQFIITSVTYKLTKNNHKLHLDYGAIQSVLADKRINTPTIKDVSDAVIQIRSEKLPNPKEIGNSGSFFKNPIVTETTLKNLQESYPNIPNYKQKDQTYKIAAGWLIEHTGFKGIKKGSVGTHHKQALVLVNHDNATAKEVYDFAQEIIKKVHEQYGITLEPEVRFIY